MTTFAEQSFRCPLCTEVFPASVIQSWSSAGPRTSDLRRISLGEDPIPLLVHACPGCGFCGLAGDFAPGAIQPELPVEGGTLRERVHELYGANARSQALEPARAYERAAEIALLRGAPPLVAADRWLRAAWLHGDAEAADDERRCRMQALRLYRLALEARQGFLRQEDTVVVLYLVAELERRLGDKEAASEIFAEVIRLASAHEPLRGLAAAAQQQATSPREFLED